MAQFTITLPEPPGPAQAVYLVFNIGRAFGLEAVLPDKEGLRFATLARTDAKHPFPNVIQISSGLGEVRLEADTAERAIQFIRELHRIEIHSRNEYPELVQLVFEGVPAADGTAVHWLLRVKLRAGVEKPELEFGDFEEVRRPVLEWVLNPENLIRAVHEWLAAHAGEQLTPYRRFFAEMDRLTNIQLMRVAQDPILIPQRQDVETWVLRVGERLRLRMLDRMLPPDAGGEDPQLLLDGSDPGYLGKLSSWFLAIFKRQPGWADANGRLQLAPIEAAFEHFAAGDLRYEPRWPGIVACQPSGFAYFQFAEVGFVARSRDFDVLDWEDLLPVLVRTQEVYARTYEPLKVGPLETVDYTITNFDPNRPPLSPGQALAFTQKYAGLGLDQLPRQACLNVRAALRL